MPGIVVCNKNCKLISCTWKIYEVKKNFIVDFLIISLFEGKIQI